MACNKNALERWHRMGTKSIMVRQTVLGDGIPKICIPLMAANRKELAAQMKCALDGPHDVIEWRADAYREIENKNWISDILGALRVMAGETPILFTFRTKEEGGERKISMDEYRRINLEAAACKNADLIDLEWNRGSVFIQEIAVQVQLEGAKVLGSFHDFRKTPAKTQLLDIICGMQEIGADITKIAVMPRRESDVLTLLDVSVALKEQYADRPYITMSMSRTGAVSRLCGALTGSALTFAVAGKASAPGQIDAELVKSILEVL